MDTRIRNNLDKGLNETIVHPVSHFSVNYPLWSCPNEQQLVQPIGGGMSPKSEAQFRQDAIHLCLQLRDKGSLLSPSPARSHREEADSGATNSRISSESGQTQSHSKSADSQVEHSAGHTGIAFNPKHWDYRHSVAHNMYPYGEPQFDQFLKPYVAHTPPQMVGLGVAPSRVPLPFNVADEGPIYVNAKQYNGIMRRRQSRAKLEAQNKLVKVRKPYLHESRHQHALNRVRGTGGRFVSKNKVPQTASLSHSKSGSNKVRQTTSLSHFKSGSISAHQTGRMLNFEVQQQGGTRTEDSFVYHSELANVPNETMYRPPEIRFSSGMLDGATMQGSSFSDGNKQCASIVW